MGGGCDTVDAKQRVFVFQIEFDVQMTCQKCVNAVETALSKVEGVNNYQISLEQGSVVVDTNLPHSKIQEIIETTGRKAVLKGYGGGIQIC